MLKAFSIVIICFLKEEKISQDYAPYKARSVMTCKDAEKKALPDQGRAIRTNSDIITEEEVKVVF